MRLHIVPSVHMWASLRCLNMRVKYHGRPGFRGGEGTCLNPVARTCSMLCPGLTGGIVVFYALFVSLKASMMLHVGDFG